MSSKVFQNGTVLTFDVTTNKVKVLRQASVWIVDDRIKAIVESIDALPIPQDSEIIDVEGKIVSPGFINTHIHSWQTAYRTLAPDVTLAHYFPWTSQMSEASKAFSADDVYNSSLEGYMEGLNSGVTTFLEHAHLCRTREGVVSAYDAAADSGARVLWCPDIVSYPDHSVAEQWKTLESIHQQGASKLVSLGLAYDGMLWTSPEELKTTHEMIKKLDMKVITVHHLGGPWPASPSSPSALYTNGLHNLDVPIVISHAGHLTPSDVAALRDHNLHVSITPESEYHYGHGQATGHTIMDQASLGIDTNWTFSGDIITQARLWLQSTRNKNYQALLDQGKLPRQTPMTVEQAFLLATRQGGRALHQPHDLGVLQEGAKADLVVFSSQSPNMLGWHDPVAAIILHANASDVEHVLVDGVFRKRDFKLVPKKHDWTEIKNRFLDTVKRIQPAAMNPPPVPDNMFGSGEMGDVEVVSTIKS